MQDSAITNVLTDLIPAIILLILGRWWGEARAARKQFHATRISEEEAKAYDEVVACFQVLRRFGAYRCAEVEAHESGRPLPPAQAAGPSQDDEQQAINKLREIAMVGPAALSGPAVAVIRGYLRWHYNPESDTGDGYWYEHDVVTRRYFRDFVERRRVDLGQMSPLIWYVKKWYREWKDLLFVWREWLRSSPVSWRHNPSDTQAVQDLLDRSALKGGLDTAYNQSISIRVIGLAAGLVLVLYQLYCTARFARWSSFSTADMVGRPGIPWGSSPHDWLGLHWVMPQVPAALAIALLGFAFAWVWYYIRRVLLKRKYRRVWYIVLYGTEGTTPYLGY